MQRDRKIRNDLRAAVQQETIQRYNGKEKSPDWWDYRGSFN